MYADCPVHGELFKKPQEPAEGEFTDTERLEWVMKNHYQFREIYYRFAGTATVNTRVFREKIDQQLQEQKAHTEARSQRDGAKPHGDGPNQK